MRKKDNNQNECANKGNIIHGVDVSKCWYRDNPFGTNICKIGGFLCPNTAPTIYTQCSQNLNCDYKQRYRIEAQYNAVLEQNKSLQTELKQKEQKLTDIMNSKFKELGRALDAEDRCKEALNEIENKINNLHYQTLIFHSGKAHVLADRIQETKNKILDIINKAKEVNNA